MVGDNPVEIRDERDPLPVPEMLAAELEVLPRRGRRDPLETLEHQDDPDLLPQVPLGARRRASGRRGSRMPRSYRRLESDDAFADRRSASVSEEGIPRGSRAPTRRQDRESG